LQFLPLFYNKLQLFTAKVRNNNQNNLQTNNKINSVWYLAIVCFVASLGGLLFGFDTAVISGTFGFVEKQFALSKLKVGWFGSSALVGSILGALIAGALSDKYGRKPILIIAGVLSIFMATIQLLRVKHYKRMLAFSSLEHMGLVAIALGVG